MNPLGAYSCFLFFPLFKKGLTLHFAYFASSSLLLAFSSFLSIATRIVFSLLTDLLCAFSSPLPPDRCCSSYDCFYLELSTVSVLPSFALLNFLFLSVLYYIIIYGMGGFFLPLSCFTSYLLCVLLICLFADYCPYHPT
jgi:hypothetical protein